MSVRLWHGKTFTPVRYVRMALTRQSLHLRLVTSARLEARQSPSFSRLVHTKAWQNLNHGLRPFTWSVTLRHGSVLVTSSPNTTRPSCHNRTRPRRNTWLTYDPRYEPATGSTHPRLTQHTVITGNIDLPTMTDTSFLRWSSSCILRLVRPQLSTSTIQLHSTTRPTSAFDFDHPAAFYDSAYTSYPRLTSSCAHLRLNYTSYQCYHPSWRPYSTITDLTHVCRSDNKLSFVIFVISPLFLHCLCHLLTCIKLNSFAGVDMLIGSATCLFYSASIQDTVRYWKKGFNNN